MMISWHYDTRNFFFFLRQSEIMFVDVSLAKQTKCHPIAIEPGWVDLVMACGKP